MNRIMRGVRLILLVLALLANALHSAPTEAPTSVPTSVPACTPGKYSPSGQLPPGSTECTICPAGSFSAIGASVCTTCPKGKYSSGGAEVCADCDAGYYTNVEGTQDACAICPAGSFSPIGSAFCYQCAVGKYAVNEGSEFCAKCPIGQFAGVESSTACEECEAGKFAVVLGSSACTPCSVGYYTPDSLECYPCAKGRYQLQSLQEDCIDCAPGTFGSIKGSPMCSDCQPGTYAPASKTINCDICPGGKYANGFRDTACTNCEAGKYSLPEAAVCLDCPAGKYTSLSSQGVCVTAERGFYAEKGATSQTPCPNGTYSDSPGAGDCITVKAGQYTYEEDLLSYGIPASSKTITYSFNGAAQVTVTGTGDGGVVTAADMELSLDKVNAKCRVSITLQNNGTNSFEISFPFSGTSTLEFMAPLAQNTSFSLVGGIHAFNCTAGTYSEYPGSASCSPCDEGSVSQIAAASCDICEAGKYQGASFAECIYCPDGYYQGNAESTACIPAPAGGYATVYPNVPTAENGLPGPTSFTLCTPGYFQDTPGSSQCTGCAPSTFSNTTGLTHCYLCPAGKWTDTDKQTECMFYPSSEPTKSPTELPTNRPSHHPTNEPTKSPTELPTSRPSQSCKTGEYVDDNRQCALCPIGRFKDYPNGPIGESNACKTCLPGKFSDERGSDTCKPAPKGAFVSEAGAKSYELCPQSQFSSEEGDTKCSTCPSGRITNGTGAKAELECVSPEWNFIQGFIAAGLVMPFCWQYLLISRFERLAFLRQWRVTRRLIDSTRQLTAAYTIYAHKERAERALQWDLHRIRNILIIVCTVMILAVSTIVVVLIEVAGVSFKSMILFKGLDLDIPFIEHLDEFWEQIAADLDLHYLYTFAVTPFLDIIKLFANIKIDFEAVKVTCDGASSPYELGVNMLVAGIAVILVGSDIQLFKQLSYHGYLDAKASMMTKMTYVKWHLKLRGKSTTYSFFKGGILFFGAFGVFIVENFARVDIFQTSLQYIMSLITISSFIGKGGIHSINDACNSVKGYEGFETMISTIISVTFYLLAMPFIYELSKLMVPGIPFYTDKITGEVKKMRLLNFRHNEGGEDDIERSGFKKYMGFHRFLKHFSYFSPDLWWAQAIMTLNKISAAHIPMDVDWLSPSLLECQQVEERKLQSILNGEVVEASEDTSKNAIVDHQSVCPVKGAAVVLPRKRLEAIHRVPGGKYIVSIAPDGQSASLIEGTRRVGDAYEFSIRKQWIAASAGCILLRLSRSTGGVTGVRIYNIYSTSFQDAITGGISELNNALKRMEEKETGVLNVVILLGSSDSVVPEGLPGAFVQGNTQGSINPALPYLLIHGRHVVSEGRGVSKRCIDGCVPILSSYRCCGHQEEARRPGFHVHFSIDNYASCGYDLSNHDIVRRPLHSLFDTRSTRELYTWELHIEQQLPSYYSLCCLEYMAVADVVRKWPCGRVGVAVLWLPLVLLIAVGVLHIFTAVGRTATYIVFHKAFTFIRLCFGVWYECDEVAFGLHKKVFGASSVWCNPNVLLRVKEAGLEDTFDRARECDSSSGTDASTTKVLHPCVKLLALQDKLREDYSAAMYSAIAMRAALLQAMPFMSLLSIFVTNVCRNPLFVRSIDLKSCLLRDWVRDARVEARATIQERIDQEANIRDDETHLNAYQQDNPDTDEYGVAISAMRRQQINDNNKEWRARLQIVLNNRDRVNEWEVNLLAVHLVVGSSNYISFAMGLFRYVFTVWLLLVDDSQHQKLVICSMVVFVPYVFLTTGLSLVMRMWLSLYITDEELGQVLGFFTWPFCRIWACFRSEEIVSSGEASNTAVIEASSAVQGLWGGESSIESGNIAMPPVKGTDRNPISEAGNGTAVFEVEMSPLHHKQWMASIERERDTPQKDEIPNTVLPGLKLDTTSDSEGVKETHESRL